jgi:hypothetical protein
LRFGDTGSLKEEGYHTLGKLFCWGWTLRPIFYLVYTEKRKHFSLTFSCSDRHQNVLIFFNFRFARCLM